MCGMGGAHLDGNFWVFAQGVFVRRVARAKHRAEHALAQRVKHLVPVVHDLPHLKWHGQALVQDLSVVHPGSCNYIS